MCNRFALLAVLGGGTVFLLFFGVGRTPLTAQLGERPGNSSDNPIDMPRDLSGLSIKNPRIRVVHTTDPAKKGGSMYLQQVDPWLGYQWGRSLTQRNFRERDGVYGDAGKLDGTAPARRRHQDDGPQPRQLLRAPATTSPTATAAPARPWPRTAATAATRRTCSAAA